MGKKKEHHEKKSKKSKSSTFKIDLKENKTLIAEIVGAFVVLVLIVILLVHACSIKKYTISFDSNGGTQVTSQKVIEDYKVKKPTTPTREGYTFDGWYYNDELFDFNTKITSNIKLEARWIEIAPSNPDKVSGITLEQTEVFLAPAGSINLVALVEPETAIDQSLTWSSSDTSIATVDSNGKITAVKEGKAVITVTTTDGGFTATANVTVTNQNIPVTGVSLNKTKLDLKTGKQETLRATVAPGGATNSAVTWSSSNANVAKVDANGKITAVKEGTAVITVTTKDGNKKATCRVTVKNIPVTNVSLNKTSITIEEGKTGSLSAIVKPNDATNKNVTWSSNNTNVATVDGNGKVTAKGVGEAIITVTTKDGNKKATCRVTVIEKTYKYTYKIEGIDMGGGQVVEYKLFIYKDGVNITPQVTQIVTPASRQFVSDGGYFKISSNYTGTVTFKYDGKTLTATK